MRWWVRCLVNTSLLKTPLNTGVLKKKVRWWGVSSKRAKLIFREPLPTSASRILMTRLPASHSARSWNSYFFTKWMFSVSVYPFPNLPISKLPLCLYQSGSLLIPKWHTVFSHWRTEACLQTSHSPYPGTRLHVSINRDVEATMTSTSYFVSKKIKDLSPWSPLEIRFFATDLGVIPEVCRK